MRKIRQIALLVVCVLCMWCGSALAYTPVQFDDTHSLSDILERYNDYRRRVDSDGDTFKYLLPTSFIKYNESYMPYTTAYITQNSLTGIGVVFCINGNGRVASFTAIVPETYSASDAVVVASRIVRAMDDGHAWENVMTCCAKALQSDEMQVMWHPVTKRYYVFFGRKSEGTYQIMAFAAQD